MIRKKKTEAEKASAGTFGRHAKSLREARGLTQEGLAERAGLSADTIRRLEHGDFSPSLNTLRKLCSGLSLAISTLFLSLDEIDEGGLRALVERLGDMTRAQRRVAMGAIVGIETVLAQLDQDQGPELDQREPDQPDQRPELDQGVLDQLDGDGALTQLDQRVLDQLDGDGALTQLDQGPEVDLDD